MTAVDFDIQHEEKQSKGPVCADCGKPFRVSADKGGCACPRHPVRPEAASPKILAVDRQAAALERQASALEGIFAVVQEIFKTMREK